MSNTFQNKLLNYTQKPPQKVWDVIATALDKETSSTLSHKLYHFKEMPPEPAWQKIKSQLDAIAEPVKVVSFYNKYRRPLRYSAAAAILVFLAITTSLLITKKTKTEGIAQTGIPLTTSQNSPFIIPSQPHEATNTITSANVSNEENVQGKKPAFKLLPQKTVNFYTAVKKLFPKVVERKHTIVSDASIDKYMIYSDEEGNAVKLPKKLFDFFSCAAEEIACKEKMQLLQQKFATTSLSTDFTGILELLKNIKENQ